ncbi:MAG: hypothetical protein JW828_16965 [Sedimentisphaerales bacterium]|nr:hypothetical protein [Sedimentisphaerales bacterium]
MPYILKKTVVYVSLCFVVLCVVVWFLFNAFSDFITPEPIKQINQIRVKVLYHTNHEELLKACRDKLATYNNSLPDEKIKNEGITTTVKSGPGFGTGEDIPQKTHMKILDLKPTFVEISRKMIHLEMCTGFYSVSVSAFPDGVEGFGDLKLIDGLWYSDDGFRKNPDFSKYLEQLKEYRFEE